MTSSLRTAAALAVAAALLAACADGPENTLAADPAFESQAGDTLTGIGEADDPLGGGAGDVSGSRI
jgi:hypothetical protein